MNQTTQQLQVKLSGQKVLVLGLGLQGGSKVANRLVQLGAHVRVTDQKTSAQLQTAVQQLHPSIELFLGQDYPELISWADIILKNPAVPYQHPLIQAALEQGKEVTTETVLAMISAKDRTIGVTGTRGKTTTTHLIHHILHQAGWQVELGGNIPQKPSLDVVLDAPEQSWFVLELSSFQLEALDRHRISPHVGVLTSLSPDHLNRYASMQQYVDTKTSLFRWQQSSDLAVWFDQPEWNDDIYARVQDGVESLLLTSAEVEEITQWAPTPLPGEHNRRNVALAARTCLALGVERQVIARAVASFYGVPYRQQVIPTQDGLTWINDTTATTPTALQTALEAQPDQNFILITGGTSKHLPFPAELKEELRRQAPHIVWLAGSGTTELLDELQLPETPATYQSMSKAVQAARTLAAQTGITRVLLSPGFSSFENFTNEFDRGDQFNASLLSTSPQT